MKSIHNHNVSSPHNSIQLQGASADTGQLPETAAQMGKRKKDDEEPKSKPLPARRKVRTL